MLSRFRHGPGVEVELPHIEERYGIDALDCLLPEKQLLHCIDVLQVELHVHQLT